MGTYRIESSCISHLVFQGYPKPYGLALDMSPRALEEVIYFAAYVVIDPKDTPLEHKSIMTEREYRERLREFGYGSFVAENGCGSHPRPLKASRP